MRRIGASVGCLAGLTLGLAWLGCGTCPAQQTVLVESQGTNNPFITLDVNTLGTSGAKVATDTGTPDGIPSPLDPLVPGMFINKLGGYFGFEYLRPLWSNSAINLAIPGSASSSLAALGGTGNVSEQFAFVPKFGLEYKFTDQGFGVAASGQLMTLTGELHRSLATTTGSGTVDARAQLDIAVANLVEATSPIEFKNYEFFQESCLEDVSLIVSLGARYVGTHQHYHADLVSGSTTGAVDSDQAFNGFGLTGSINSFQPLCRGFFWYSSSRGSILVGKNNRTSQFSVLTPGNAATNNSGTFTDDKTDFVAVGEFELGVGWEKTLAASYAAATNQVGKLVWVRLGAVYQLWGDLGLLPLATNPPGSTDSSLSLIGFCLLAGVEF